MKNIPAFRKDLQALSRIRAPHELFAFLEEKAAPSFELSSLYLFIFDSSAEEYTCAKDIKTKLELDGPIIATLLDTKKAISIKHIDEKISVALTEERRAFLLSLKDRLNKLKVQACIPGFTEGKLITVFLLEEEASKNGFLNEELEMLALIADKSARIIYNFGLLEKETKLFVQSIRDINEQLELKDPYTRGHSHRVEGFSVNIGEKLKDGLDDIPHGRVILYYAAEFHDLGKIHIPDSILKKNGPLDAEEYAKIKEHPLESVKILQPMEKWFGKTFIDAVLYHHENFDGTGYPFGKKGEDINILARIIRVADSFDTMITARPYKKAMVQHKALLELKNGRGTQFDPKVVDAFLEAYKEGLFADIFSQIPHISKDASL